jgi:hypothetical protein
MSRLDVPGLGPPPSKAPRDDPDEEGVAVDSGGGRGIRS